MMNLSAKRTVTISGAALPAGPTGDPALQVRSLSGTEALSSIYTYTLDCCTPLESIMQAEAAANLDLAAMIGKELTIKVQLEGMGSYMPGIAGGGGASNIGAGFREIGGIVTEARYVGQLQRQSRYQLQMKPWIWLADQRSDFRIFQRKTVVEIIEAVFENYMYSYDVRLSETYPVLDYQVQYGETDFRFIQRLMAEHGIYWFFEHEDGFHRMVLVDHLGAHKPVKSAAYQTLWYVPPGRRIDREHVDYFDMSGILQPGRVTTNDYDFKKPTAPLIAQNDLPRDTAHNDFERYEWPGDYTDASQGEQIARLRMEELRARAEHANGGGIVRDVECGTTFRLEGYPHEAANQEYLVVSASFAASEAGDSTDSSQYRLHSDFMVQPATTVFRPLRSPYPKPHTNGPQTATVTGPAGQEIWTDQYGRVKLSFRWDRSGVKDQNSSCWVRVSYPWAGGGFGGVNIPRVGTEVIVDFENGDPDRPIVVGRLYNAETMPPWDLPGNATQSGMLSRSMKGSAETANGLRFEDKQGAEEVWLQAQKDMNTTVKNNESHSVNVNRIKTVGGNETTSVTGTRTETVTGDESITLNSNRKRAVTKNDTVTIGGDQDTTITGKQKHIVDKNREAEVHGNDTFTVNQNRTAKVIGTEEETVHLAKTTKLLNTHTLKVSQHQLVTVGEGQRVEVTGLMYLTASEQIKLVCGASSITMSKDGTIEIKGVKLSSIGSTSHAIVGETVTVDGKTLTSTATAEHTVCGATLKLNP